VSKSDPLDISLDNGPDQPRPHLDLDRIIGAPESPAEDLPLFPPSQAETSERPASARRAEAFGGGGRADDAPLITAPSRPRAPLGVRRATPEVPRARPRATKPPGEHGDTLFETPPAAVLGHAFEPARYSDANGEELAAPSSRILAALVDVALLSALDAVVLYFTLRLLGLATAQVFELPLVPLLAFFLLLNGGYFIAFTAVGGQSIGKMALGIKVISQEDTSVPIGRATVRTLAYLVSALPLGAGFLPGVISADRLALHDRLAHTRVIRPSST
jgi:uncharacterized RDD family membrane protein YckC